MISNGAKAAIARAISSISGATLPASLRTGTTTEIRGATPDGGGVALVIDLSGLDPAAFYGAISARATLLIRLGDGPASVCTALSVPTTKPRRRRANQSRTH